MEDLSSLESVHVGQEPDWMRPAHDDNDTNEEDDDASPDEPLQAGDRQLGPGVRAAAGVREVEADPTVAEAGLEKHENNSEKLVISYRPLVTGVIKYKVTTLTLVLNDQLNNLRNIQM